MKMIRKMTLLLLPAVLTATSAMAQFADSGRAAYVYVEKTKMPAGYDTNHALVFCFGRNSACVVNEVPGSTELFETLTLDDWSRQVSDRFIRAQTGRLGYKLKFERATMKVVYAYNRCDTVEYNGLVVRTLYNYKFKFSQDREKLIVTCTSDSNDRFRKITIKEYELIAID